MIKKPAKKKRAPNPFDFCPKHNAFYASCGCKWDKKTKDKDEEEVINIEEE